LVASLGAVEDVVLIGHSMGGLVVRSACHYAVQHGAAWVERVRRVVYLGTPHDGADLERVARAAESMLRSVSNPITRLVGDVIGVRSQGVKDLGCGTLLEPDVMDDWPANTTAHHRRAVPWLAHARHYVVSGTLTDDPDHIAALVFGDGLVARGGDLDALSAHHVEVFPGVHHFELARSPRVYAAIREWCTAGEG
jgi:pimeloyl-ACP methyl ester carboxylesterase